VPKPTVKVKRRAAPPPAAQLAAELQARTRRVWLDGGRLRWEPGPLMTTELVAAVRANEAEVAALLEGEPA
jgi:hypothetical protein